MKFTISPFVIAIVAIGMTVPQAHGQVKSGRPITEAENLQESDFLVRIRNKPLSEKLATLNDFLQKYPENRSLRLRRAEMLMDLGRALDAEMDLAQLVQQDSHFYGLRPDRIELAQVMGHPEQALPLLQELSKSAPGDTSLPAGVIEANIQELSPGGDPASAWKKYLAVTGKKDAFYLNYGDFQVRRGHLDEAVAAYQVFLDNRVPGVGENIVDKGRLRQIGVFWAMGRIKEAELTVFQLLHNMEKRSADAADALPAMMVMAYVISHVDTLDLDDKIVQDRRYSEALIKSAGDKLDLQNLYRYDIIIAFLDHKILKDSVATQLTIILKDAPYLEWAGWSDLALALAAPDQAQRVTKELRDDLLPAKILAQHLKMPTTRTQNGPDH